MIVKRNKNSPNLNKTSLFHVACLANPATGCTNRPCSIRLGQRKELWYFVFLQ